MRLPPLERISGRLTRGSAVDLARLDARGAHVQVPGRPVDLHAPTLNVRVPAARGAAVRERHVVAEARPLAADVADGSHGIAPLGDSQLGHRPVRAGTVGEEYPTTGP